MKYTATLDGEEIAFGDLAEIRGPVVRAMVPLFDADPEGVGPAMVEMNKAFEDPFMEYAVQRDGHWSVDLGGKELRIVGEGR